MKTTVITIALAMLTATAFSQENKPTQSNEKAQTEKQVQTQKGPNFVDNNNNGICDNFEKGICPRRGQGRNAKGRFFVDKDNYQNGNRQGRGKRIGKKGKGQGRGPNFVDKNNNGICDRRENK